MSEKKSLNGGVIALGTYGTIGQSAAEDKVNILLDDSNVSDSTSLFTQDFMLVIFLKKFKPLNDTL
jgi:hypothetical protein